MLLLYTYIQRVYIYYEFVKEYTLKFHPPAFHKKTAGLRTTLPSAYQSPLASPGEQGTRLVNKSHNRDGCGTQWNCKWVRTRAQLLLEHYWNIPGCRNRYIGVG